MGFFMQAFGMHMAAKNTAGYSLIMVSEIHSEKKIEDFNIK